MNWIEKVLYMKEKKDKDGYSGKYLIDISYETPKWQTGELEKLILPYPWLPESYIDFIKKFDDLALVFVSFYGSKDNNGILKEEIEYWREEGLLEDYFPFGKYADGSIFAFHKNGGVYFLDKYDYEFEKPEKVCDTFEEFIGDYVLGKKYPKFGAPDEFLEHLGWV
jgi:hypothetical protein